MKRTGSSLSVFISRARESWKLWVGLGLFWSWFWVYLIKPSGLVLEFVTENSFFLYRLTALLSIIVCFLAVAVIRLRFPTVRLPRTRYYLIALILYVIVATIPFFPMGGSPLVEMLQLIMGAMIAALLFVGWGATVSATGTAETTWCTALSLVVAILCTIFTFLLDFGQQDLLMTIFPIASAIILITLTNREPNALEGIDAEQKDASDESNADSEMDMHGDAVLNTQPERFSLKRAPWRFLSILFIQGMALGLWHFLYDIVVLEKCSADFCIFRVFNDLFTTRGMTDFVGFASIIGLVAALGIVILSIYALHMNFRKLIYQIGLPLLALGFLIIAFDGGIILEGGSHMTGDIFIYGELFHTTGYFYIFIITWVLCSYLVTEKQLDGIALFATCGLLLMAGQLFGYGISTLLGTWGISGTDLCMLAIFILLTSGLIAATGDGLGQDWSHAAPTRADAMGVFKKACMEVVESGGLTPRETEVFILLARGRNLGFIQSELFISRDTVKSHLRNIYRKLGIHSQQELIDLVEQNIAEIRGKPRAKA